MNPGPSLKEWHPFKGTMIHQIWGEYVIRFRLGNHFEFQKTTFGYSLPPHMMQLPLLLLGADGIGLVVWLFGSSLASFW